jgi:hypothetical protein
METEKGEKHDHDEDNRWENFDFQHLLIYLAVGLTVVGYLFQLVGFRSVHSSMALAQLGGTIFMTVLRAWIRRGLSERPDVHYEVTRGREQDWLAMYIPGCKVWRVQAGFKQEGVTFENPNVQESTLAARVVGLRAKMAELSPWATEVDEQVSMLSTVIEETFDSLVDFYINEDKIFIDIDVLVLNSLSE